MFAFIGKEVRSRAILEAAVQRSQVYMNMGAKDVARQWLASFLTATAVEEIIEFDFISSQTNTDMMPPIGETAVGRLLSQEDLSLAWLIYLHLLRFETLPGQVFCEYPFQHHLRSTPFAIKWALSALNETNITIILDHLVRTWDVPLDPKDSVPYSLILRNHCEFNLTLAKPKIEDLRNTLVDIVGKHPHINITSLMIKIDEVVQC